MLGGALLGNLLLALACFVGLPLVPRRWTAARLLIIGITLLVLITYAHWRWTASLTPDPGLALGGWQLLFLLVESISLGYAAWSLVVFARRRERHAEADAGQTRLLARPIERWPRIDLLIPTYNEGPAILRGTLQAARQIAYPRLAIHVLDDGGRPWLAELCREWGLHYHHRGDNRGAKGGNLDFGVQQTDGDYVACLDADFQARPDFALRLAAILEDPAIGLVQVPQHYRNADPVQRNLGGSAAWTEEQRLFFDVALPARDAWGNALCVGSGWLARRAVFDRLGGYPAETVAEDVQLGYACKAVGWQTAYLDEPLALGLAPEDLPTYIVQRSRWSRGAMQLLSAPSGPFRLAGLSLLDRLFYCDISWYWFGHCALALVLAAPLVYGIAGLPAFDCNLAEITGHILPRIIILTGVMAWLTEGRCLPLITPIKKLLTLFWVLPGMIATLLRPDATPFQVSDKGGDHAEIRIHWRLLAPFLICLLATLLAIALTYRHDYSRFAWSDYTALNMVLASYNLVVLFLCCCACVERPPTAEEADGPQYVTGSLTATLKSLARRFWTAD